jgi:hypothetical protein
VYVVKVVVSTGVLEYQRGARSAAKAEAAKANNENEVFMMFERIVKVVWLDYCTEERRC